MWELLERLGNHWQEPHPKLFSARTDGKPALAATDLPMEEQPSQLGLFLHEIA